MTDFLERHLQNKTETLKLDLFQNQEETQEKSEFLKMDVEKQDKYLGQTISGISYINGRNKAYERKEWFLKQEMPTDAQIKAEVEKDYREMYGKNIGWNERRKAIKEYKKKFATMKKINERERDTLAEQIKKETLVSKKVDIKGVRDEANILALFDIKEEKEMVSYMSAMRLKTTVSEDMSEEDKEQIEKNKETKLKALEDVFSRFEKMDTKDFEFNSIEELVEKAPLMKQKAFIGGVMRATLIEYRSAGGKLDNKKEFEMLARIDAIEALTPLYDAAIKLYGSPYYASLRTKTVENITEADIDKVNNVEDYDNRYVSKGLMDFIDGLTQIRTYISKGRKVEDDHAPDLKIGQKFDSYMGEYRERRKWIGKGVDDGKSLEVIKRNNAMDFEYLKSKQDCPKEFNEKSYELYKKARAVNEQIMNPELGELVNRPKKTINGETAEISRVAGAVLRTVKYDEKWKPVSEEDEKNHEWNKKYCTIIGKMADGTAKESEIKTAEKMVSDELKKNFPSDFDYPDPSVFDEIHNCIRNGGELYCKWIEDQLENPAKMVELSQRNLCFSNIKKIFPNAVRELERENKNLSSEVDKAVRLGEIVNLYSGIKYGMKLDTGTNAKPDAFGIMIKDTMPDYVDAIFNDYKESYNKSNKMDGV